MTIDESIKIALQHHQNGRLTEAECIYRQVLKAAPNHPNALCLLGRIVAVRGENETAIDLLQRAIAAAPRVSAYHNDLAIILKRAGRLDEAIAASKRAIQFQPDNFEAYNSLGNCLREQHKLTDAIAAYRRAIAIKSDLAELHRNLGVALRDHGSLEEAIPHLRQAIKLQPQNSEAYCDLAKALRDQGMLDLAIEMYGKAIAINPVDARAYCHLGNVLTEQEKYDQALAMYDRAIAINPDYAQAHYNRGKALGEKGKSGEAIAAYQHALQLSPEHAESHYNLGIEINRKGLVRESIESYQRALALKPNYAEALNNLGTIWKDQGRMEDAIACFRQAIRINPQYRAADDNILYCLTFDPGADAAALLAEGKRWNQQHAVPLRSEIQTHSNDRNPDRRLRIGYVSPDFREHPVGRFMLSLLDRHDHSAVEIFCYSDAKVSDEISRQLQARSQTWRETAKLSDLQLAQTIREDRIDILVDLALHMSNNRLLVFARKPAPVQATFAGYPGSTGLETIGYRLTDPYLDPPGLADEFYSEKTIHLPDTFWCNHLMSEDPPVNAAPAHHNGFITFGSLNNFCKASDAIIAHWAQILNQVPRSRMLLLGVDEESRARALHQFSLGGIEANRVEFVGFQARPEYLKTYHRIDIGLDTWPYNGHATSFDSFWMAVPVVTLVGPTVVGRAGLSQLTNLGLPELIGHTPEQFVKIAVDLAMYLPRLSELRSTMRQRMKNSPLMDADRFARGMESAYRSMWKSWCASV